MTKRRSKTSLTIRRVAGWSAFATTLYLTGVRPWYMHWGATEEEIKETMPGDELIPRPLGSATRAITIEAPPSAVWPWIVQMGYKRGGFYSYDALENIAVRMTKATIRYRSANEIVPELQNLKVGDPVPITPVGGDLTVRALEPEQALVLGIDDRTTGAYMLADPVKKTYLAMTWAYVLKRAGENKTRLIIRARADYKPRTLSRLSTYMTYYPEPLHFIMERKTLLGIRARAELAWLQRPAPVVDLAWVNAHHIHNELEELVSAM